MLAHTHTHQRCLVRLGPEHYTWIVATLQYTILSGKPNTLSHFSFWLILIKCIENVYEACVFQQKVKTKNKRAKETKPQINLKHTKQWKMFSKQAQEKCHCKGFWLCLWLSFALSRICSSWKLRFGILCCWKHTTTRAKKKTYKNRVKEKRWLEKFNERISRIFMCAAAAGAVDATAVCLLCIWHVG